jgi:predicted  nucleic acid-binding Zn-ribbon protein
MERMKTQLRMGMLAAVLAAVCGCSTMYYSTMEKFGQEKRDILVKRVDAARDSQQETQEVFQDALEQFGAVVKFDGGNLQKQYDKMSAELARCEDRAEEVRTRIDDVDRVARDLFREWAAEAKQYQNAEYRRDSEAKLRDTQRNYERMLKAMRNAESKIDPVISVFRDQVLYLKHNLNAKALASLQDEAAQIETDVNRLIQDLSAAIAEADRFIQQMGD